MTGETIDEDRDETALLIERIKSYVGYSWKGMAKDLSGHGFMITQDQMKNTGLGRTPASPLMRERVIGLAKQVGLKNIVDDDEADTRAVVDLAVPMLSMGIGREAYEQTQRDYSGYYIGIRANERDGYISAWTKLMSLQEPVGVPRFNTWRPDEGDGCIITTGYYFSSMQFLYMVSHPINDVSIRYSVVRRSSGNNLIGITTGVSMSRVIQSTNIYLKKIAAIDEEGISRRSFLDKLGEFSSQNIREKFPKEAAVVLAQTSMIKPSGD